MWRRTTARPLASWIARSEVAEVRLSSDGSFAAASDRDRTWIWKAPAAGARQASGVNALSVAPNGSTIACGLLNHELVILDAGSHESIARYRFEARGRAPEKQSRTGRFFLDPSSLPVYAVHFTPDGTRLVSGDEEGVLRIHDARTARVLKTATTSNAAILAIDVSPEGRWVAIGRRDGTVQLQDLAGVREPRLLHKDAGGVLGVAFSPDGKMLAWGGEKGVALLDMATLRVAWSITTDGRVNAVSFDREGRRLVAGLDAGSRDVSVGVWKAATGDRVVELTSGRARDDVVSVGFSPDGRRIVAGSSEGLVHIFSTDPYELLVSLEQGSSVEALAFTPAGDRLIIGLWNGDVDVWDIGSDASVAVAARGQ